MAPSKTLKLLPVFLVTIQLCCCVGMQALHSAKGQYGQEEHGSIVGLSSAEDVMKVRGKPSAIRRADDEEYGITMRG